MPRIARILACLATIPIAVGVTQAPAPTAQAVGLNCTGYTSGQSYTGWCYGQPAIYHAHRNCLRVIGGVLHSWPVNGPSVFAAFHSTATCPTGWWPATGHLILDWY